VCDLATTTKMFRLPSATSVFDRTFAGPSQHTNTTGRVTELNDEGEETEVENITRSKGKERASSDQRNEPHSTHLNHNSMFGGVNASGSVSKNHGRPSWVRVKDKYGQTVLEEYEGSWDDVEVV
jgi:hypothetical protein